MDGFNMPEGFKSLDITLSMILSAKKNEELRSKIFLKDIEKKYHQQIELEEEILYQNKWNSPPSVEDSILEKIEDDIPVSHTSKRSYYIKSDCIEKLAAVANNIVMFDGPGNRTGYSFIKKLITDVRVIGKPSAYGVAMQATLYDKYRDSIVIKAPRIEGEYLDAATNHEIVVGKILNSLRYYIPNFSYLLGSFECGPPILRPDIKSDSEKLVTWCRSGKKVKYIIYENIKDSISLYDYCRNCSLEEYLYIVIQIVHALMIAYNKFGFTHYDLHGYNILVKDVPGKESRYIPYEGDFIYCNKIASIIDYGMSHIYLPNTKESLGFKGSDGPEDNVYFYPDGIYLDRPHPFGDCYKMLSSTLHMLKSRNSNVYAKAKGLMYFFHPLEENIDKILETKHSERVTYFGSEEYTRKVEKFRYEDFIRFSREFCMANDIEDPVISGKDYDDRLDDRIIISTPRCSIKPTMDSLPDNIDNLEELFDIIEQLMLYRNYIKENLSHINKTKIENYNNILDKIQRMIYNNSDFIKEICEKELESILSQISSLRSIRYRSIEESVSKLRESNNFNNYINDIEKSINYLDFMDEIERKLEMINYLQKNFIREEIELLNIVTKKFEYIDDRKIILDFIKSDINKLDDYISTKNKPDKIDDKLRNVLTTLVAAVP